MTPSPRCIALVKEFEGFRDTAYGDPGPAHTLTIGYGHTGPDVRPGEHITHEAAEMLLARDLEVAALAVNALKVELTQMEFDALCSFIFNVGSTAFRLSTMRHLIIAGDFKGAALEFPQWNKSGGKVLPGLVRRRAAEQALFQSLP